MWEQVDPLAYVSTDGKAQITYELVPGNGFLLGGGFWVLETDTFREEYFSLDEAKAGYAHFLRTGEVI